MPRTCIATLSATAPYSASRAHEAPKLDRETADAYEDRTWKLKAHVHEGHVFIPPMSFKMALDKAAKMLGLQIPGKGKSTYTKFFESGVLVTDPVFIASESEIRCDRIHANSDGVRGSGKRVWRQFPRIDQWTADVPFHVLANEITPDVFEQTLRQAGAFVGVGRFRPERGGFFGRFRVDGLRWQEVAI